MSTVFQVWPSKDGPITTEQFLAELEPIFWKRCAENGVDTRPKLEMHLCDRKSEARVSFLGQTHFQWHDSKYVSLSIKGLSGATQISLRENDHDDVEYWRTTAISNRPRGIKVHELEACLKPGFHWSFRRSAGQSGTVNILYGLAAGCLASLSGGYVFSCDGAWDYNRLPMNGTQLLDEYMRPWKVIDTKLRDWSERCSTSMREELAEL